MNVLIISPSGNLYGSEQVLLDFLSGSKVHYDVAVRDDGPLLKKLMLSEHVTVIPFSDRWIIWFYFKVFFSLLKGSYNTVYWNEGGHIRYCKILSSIFKRKRFIVHIRILEDAVIGRIGALNSNVELLTISSFLLKAIDSPANLVYDPYVFSEIETGKPVRKYAVGIIGRVSFSKGIGIFKQFLEEVESRPQLSNFYFVFYGDVSNDVKQDAALMQWLSTCSRVKMVGFCGEKQVMYGSIDFVLHLTEKEPLGRIFLEAIDYNVPLIGINGGGIGEVGKLLGLVDFLVDGDQATLPKRLADKLLQWDQNYDEAKTIFSLANRKARDLFSVDLYVDRLSGHLNL